MIYYLAISNLLFLLKAIKYQSHFLCLQSWHTSQISYIYIFKSVSCNRICFSYHFSLWCWKNHEKWEYGLATIEYMKIAHSLHNELLPYKWYIWRTLSLTNSAKQINKHLVWWSGILSVDSLSNTHNTCELMYIKFSDWIRNCQTAKLKSSPNISHTHYIMLLINQLYCTPAH